MLFAPGSVVNTAMLRLYSCRRSSGDIIDWLSQRLCIVAENDPVPRVVIHYKLLTKNGGRVTVASVANNGNLFRCVERGIPVGGGWRNRHGRNTKKGGLAMFFKRGGKVSTEPICMAGFVVVLGLFFAASATLASTVEELVAKAKQEGALNAMVVNSLTGKVIQQIGAAFKKRFGLNINVTLTPLGSAEEWPKAVAETKAGLVPTYDAIEGADTQAMALEGVGGVHKIDNWERLLVEINSLVRSGKVKPEQLSPGPLRGFAFAFMSRTKALLYNPRVMSREKLPKTYAELGDPRYKGMFTLAPWTTPWEPGPVAFPHLTKEQWIEIVRKAGRNAGGVMAEGAGVQRMLLGEFAFLPANTYYYFQYKAKDPQAPIRITYFEGLNVSSRAVYVVRKNARHTVAGTLFALWSGTPEAESIWQPVDFNTQAWGESDLDKQEREFIQKSGAKIIDLLDSDKGLDFLKWMSTGEGRQYKEALGRAIRGE